MLCLSLWQPWASLIAIGAKRIETRHWGPPSGVIGRTVAIHAAKQPVKKILDDFDPESRAALDILFARVSTDWIHDLPFGAVVCTARLVGAYRFGEPVSDQHVAVTSRVASSPPASVLGTDAWGNYDFGRWGWLFDQVRALPEPLPVRGRQGLFILNSVEAARVLPQ